MNDTVTVKSSIDPDRPIDIEQLVIETSSLGPLRMTSRDSPYEVLISAGPCYCEDEGCSEIVVCVWRRNGLLTRHWLISADDLLSYASLNEFRHSVNRGVLQDPRGETLLMEVEIIKEFGKTYHEINEPVCACGNCAEAIGPQSLSNKMLLSDMAFDLQEIKNLRDFAKEHNDDLLGELIDRAFEAGYSFARNVAEYTAKATLEPAALKANTILAAASAGGLARAASTKVQREAIISEMSRLIDEGKSASSAALIAANRGIGKSQAANQKAWQRHKSGT